MNSVQKVNGERRPQQVKAAVGQGVLGTVGLGGECGQEVLLLVLEFSRYVENKLRKQNHMHLLLIRDSGETPVH